MHELAVTQRILEVVEAHAREEGAVGVGEVALVVGDLSSFVDDSVQFYWDLLTPGTLAEGSRLRFERRPAAFACRACGATFAPDGRSFRCPACGGRDVEVCGGQEFYIDSITILEPEDLASCLAPSPS